MRTTFIAQATRWVAAVAALLATVQAVLGPFAYFGAAPGIDLDQWHLVIGGIFYNFTIAFAVLVPFSRSRRRWELLGIALVQYALAHTQLRLGLGSNEDVGLLAYHIPLGVLILVLSYLIVALSLGMRVASDRA